DVIMPGGVSGVSLARTARELRPKLQVLLTSGFVGEGPVLGAGEFPLLDKPYETHVLASRLRKLLDARPVRKRGRAARGGKRARHHPRVAAEPLRSEGVGKIELRLDHDEGLLRRRIDLEGAHTLRTRGDAQTQARHGVDQLGDGASVPSEQVGEAVVEVLRTE